MGKLAVVLDWPYTLVPHAWWATLWASDVRREPNVEVIRAVSTDMTCSANMLIRTALEGGASEILCFSADQTFPFDILSRLRAHNKPVVSAITATRQEGHQWLAFNIDKDGFGRRAPLDFPLTKVDIPSPGCMLIKAEVFNKVPAPWFKATLTRDGCGIVQTSDFYFFKKCKEYGVECYVDSTIESIHFTEVPLSTKTLGRKLPYLEIIPDNERIPITAADQDEDDIERERYSPYRDVEVLRLGEQNCTQDASTARFDPWRKW